MMDSNVQQSNNRNFPKGSYRAYTSLLKQYARNSNSNNSNSKAASTLPPTPPKPEIKSSILPLPPPPSQISSTTNGQTTTSIPPKTELNLETVLALNSEEMELLDMDVLKAFLEVLKQENKSTDVLEVDANNNHQANLGTSVHENGVEDIETSKQNLIQVLKEHLLRFRREA